MTRNFLCCKFPNDFIVYWCFFLEEFAKCKNRSISRKTCLASLLGKFRQGRHQLDSKTYITFQKKTDKDWKQFTHTVKRILSSSYLKKILQNYLSMGVIISISSEHLVFLHIYVYSLEVSVSVSDFSCLLVIETSLLYQAFVSYQLNNKDEHIYPRIQVDIWCLVF